MRVIAKFIWDSRVCLALVALLTALTLTLFLWAGYGETVSANPFSSDPALVPGQATTVKSRGVEAHGAKAWHDAGYKGGGSSPIKVGIIDSGFEGFSRLMGSELPPSTKVFARCYPSGVHYDINAATSNVADCERPGRQHGTRVAETLIDIAPEIELYISNGAKDSLLEASVAWMVNEGVKIINYSQTEYLNAPGDGSYGVSANRSHLLRAIDLAVDGGAVRLNGGSATTRFNGGSLWVNAGGNSAKTTWYGGYNNPDGNEWLSFRRDDAYYVANQISLSSGKTIAFSMRWDNPWPGATCNLDLHLYDKNDRVALSENPQNGGVSTPYEFIGYKAPKTGAYRLFIRSVKRTVNGSVINECPPASRPRWIQLHLHGADGSLSFTTDQGNGTFGVATTNYYQMAVPAESKNPGMLAVGGAGLGQRTTASSRSYSTPRIYPNSSRGPTIDGRMKPEIVGTNCEDVSSAQVCGTSYAAPHVAGLAALVLHRYKDAWGTKYTPADLANYLKENAAQKDAAFSGSNNVWGHGFAMLPNPAPAASFSTAPSTIAAGSSQSFTLASSSNVSGVKVVINNAGDTGKLAFGGSGATCPGSSGSLSGSRSKGVAFSIKGCTAGEATIRLYKAGSNILLRIHTVTVTLPPPTALSLSTVSGQTDRLQLTYTRSQSPHRYQFQLERRDLSARTETWTVVDTNTDSSPPETFNDVARGYHYRGRGRNCQDTSKSDTCGEWSDYTNIVEFSNPTIVISGLTGSYIAGDRDAYRVTLSDLTLDQPYTVTFLTSNSTIGYNYLCHPIPLRSFTPVSLTRAGNLSLTLHTCQVSGETATAQSGTVTAQLRKGNARGAIVATAIATVTVAKATGSLSPVPTTAFTVGHDQTFTLNTNVPNSNGVYISATYSGDTGRLTLPTAQGCHQARSGRAAVNGNAITVRGCIVGKATLKIYRSDSVIPLAAYELTINASTTALSPLPSAAAFTVGHDRTFTVTTDLADDPGLYISATYSGDSGRLTMPSSTQGCHQDSSGVRAANGDTITLRGCIAGTATIKVYRRNSSVHFATYTVTVNASTTALSPSPSTITAGHDQTFTLTTDIADNPGVWITATVAGDAGRTTLPPTRGCHQSSSGLAAVNGNAITLRGCQAGATTLTLYRSNSSVLLKSYTVTVNASDTNLSPPPATFAVGTNQTFTVATDIANNPGLWIGFNYPGDTGRLEPANQSCPPSSSGIAAVTAVNGNAITLKPCRAGTVTIKVNRSYSSVTLVSYTVTINSS